MTANRTILSVLILASAVLLGACTNSAPKAGEKAVGTKQSALISTTVGKACVGRVEPHQWTYSGLLIATADTTKCGFTTPPYVFTSLGGNQNQAAVLGVNAIRSRINTSFDVYLQNQTVTTTDVEAKAWGWYVDWEAFSPDFKSPQVCVGETSEAATGWMTYDSSTVYIDVNTSACGFTGTPTPMYQTSLGATSASWSTRGITSIYSPTNTGFRVYAQKSGLTVALAQSRGYFVMWKAVRPAVETQLKTLSRVCTGLSPTTLWQTDAAASTIFADIDTGDCGFSNEPAIFTSLAGNGSHYTALGPTSIFSPTDRGFRVYLNTTATAANAATWGWAINWARVDSY